jgi:predicted acetyltransferase
VSYDLRPIESEEFATFSRVAEAAFGAQPTDEEIERWRKDFELDRSLAAFDDGRIVGTAAAISFHFTLPGQTFVPAGGVTAVGVLPTHRRRGILTSLMRRLLDDARERGEPLSILYASESTIYGRFGFGHATTHINLEIAAKHFSLARETDPPGWVTMLDKDLAARVLPDVYDRARRQQPGGLNRAPEWWERYLADPESWRDGASARFYVVYEVAPGQADGYVCYRVKDKWEHGIPQNTVIIIELIAVTAEAYAALWRFCLSVDLVETVQARGRPVDEPLRWMLTDSRRLRVTEVADSLWVRLLDIPAALQARRYSTEDTLVFSIVDGFQPDNTGCYRLESGPDGSVSCRTDCSPDLELDVVDLGAAYLGGVRFSTLARAGRVIECTAGALRRADLMFISSPEAWCATHF